MISQLNNKSFKTLIILLLLSFVPILVYTATYEINSAGEFNNGTFFNSQYNSSINGIQLNYSSSYGNYSSPVFDGGGLSEWLNISWTPGTLYQGELPPNGEIETYPEGINMSGNTLLLHFNNNSGTITDYSGNNYDGTVFGTPNWISNGKFNGGFNFPGSNTNDYIDIDYRAADGLDDFTVSYWARIDTNSQGAIISGANAARNNEFLFFTSYSVLGVYLSDAVDTWNINANDGQWHHYVITRTGTTGEVFEDGVSLGTNTVSTNLIDLDPNGLMLGQEQDSVAGGFAAAQSYNGAVDELGIWNRPFSDEEIYNLYKRGVLRLNISVRSCDDSNCVGDTWNETFNTSPNILNVEDNPYFQYKVEFESEDTNYVSKLHNISINYNLLDTIEPNIQLINPVNETINTSSNIPDFTFSVTDNFVSSLSCNLWMNETTSGTAQIKASNASVLNGTNTIITPTVPLGENQYFWWIDCFDGSNTNSSETRIINISLGDTQSPIVSLISPINNTINTTSNTPEFVFNVTDDKASLLSCNLWMNSSSLGGPTQFGSSSTTVNTTDSIIANNSLDNNLYTWWIDCFDGSNSNVSENRTLEIFVDTQAPNITLLLPTNNNHSVDIDSSNVDFSCNIYDDVNLSNATLYTDYLGIWNSIETTSITGTSDTAQFNRDLSVNNYFRDLSINWNCEATDNTGKTNISETNFTFSNWDLGTYSNTILNETDYTIGLTSGQTSGSYTSSIKDANTIRDWNSITIGTGNIVGKPLPENQLVETSGIDMSGNVLLMHFDEDPISNGVSIGDYSGNNNNASLVTDNGATNKAVSDGIYSGALNFDGTGDYIRSDNVADDVAGTDFTIMMWLRSSTSSGQQFATAFNTNSGGNKLLFGHQAGNSDLSLYDTNGWQDSGTTIVDGNWHLAGYVFDDTNDNVMLYVDGINVYNFTTTTTVVASDRFVIGMEYDNANPGDYWNGDLDEFAVWDRKLSTNEINEMYIRGTSSIDISVKSCDDSLCSGETWQESFKDTERNLNLTDNRYFQYQINYSATSSQFSPKVSNVSIEHLASSLADPVITIISPINNSKYLESELPLYVNISSDLDLTYAGFYLNGNILQTVDLINITNKNWYETIQNISVGTNNITIIYNTSTDNYNLTYNFTLIRYENKKFTKSIESQSTDTYLVRTILENRVNESSDIILLEFVDDKMNAGSFSPIYDFLNLTYTTPYFGDIYGWNLTVTPLSTNEINYSITTAGTDYELLRNFMVGGD